MTVIIQKCLRDSNEIGFKYFFYVERGHLHRSHGEKVRFQTVGTAARIYFPEVERLFTSTAGFDSGYLPLKEGEISQEYKVKDEAEERRYPYAVYCKFGKCRDFAEGGTAPAIIVEP